MKRLWCQSRHLLPRRWISAQAKEEFERVFDALDRNKDTLVRVKYLRDMISGVSFRPVANRKLSALLRTAGLDDASPHISRAQFLAMCEAAKAESLGQLVGKATHQFTVDLEVEATRQAIAQRTFTNVAAKLAEAKGGHLNLSFPKELKVVVGPPGSGKNYVEQLLRSQFPSSRPVRFMQMIQQGVPEACLPAVGTEDDFAEAEEQYLLEQCMAELLKLSAEGVGIVIFNGFPVNGVQAEQILLLRNYMDSIRKEAEESNPAARQFLRTPVFSCYMCALHREQGTARLLARGETRIKENKPAKATLISEEAIKAQFDYYSEYNKLANKVLEKSKAVRKYTIKASSDKSEVVREIKRITKYETTSILNSSTAATLSIVPEASEVTKHARRNLVKRLDGYVANHPEDFNKVKEIIKHDLLDIIKTQAFSGVARIRTEREIFQTNPMACSILVDILSERGFHVVIDKEHRQVPKIVDTVTGDIKYEDAMTVHLIIRFPKTTLRRSLYE